MISFTGSSSKRFIITGYFNELLARSRGALARTCKDFNWTWRCEINSLRYFCRGRKKKPNRKSVSPGLCSRRTRKKKMIRGKEKQLQRFPAETRASIPPLLSLSTPPPYLQPEPHLRPGARYEPHSCARCQLSSGESTLRESLGDVTDAFAYCFLIATSGISNCKRKK